MPLLTKLGECKCKAGLDLQPEKLTGQWFLLPAVQLNAELGQEDMREVRSALRTLAPSLEHAFGETIRTIQRQSHTRVKLAMRTLE